MKSQGVRLLDVFVLGPYMMWKASQLPEPPARLVLALVGIGTILYNGRNYLRRAR